MVCAPDILIPSGIEKMGVGITNSIDEALCNKDAVNVLRMQFERDEEGAFPKQLEYFKNLSLDHLHVYGISNFDKYSSQY